MCSFDDEELMILAGRVLCDGAIERLDNADGLLVRTGYKRADLEITPEMVDTRPAQVEAMRTFQYVLGSMRALQPIFGVLREEWNHQWGYDAFVDVEDNSRIQNVSPASIWYISDDELLEKLERINSAASQSTRLHSSLILNGRAGRTSADIYMICEFIELDLKRQPSFIEKKLGIPQAEFSGVKNSACNMEPLEGGRHARRENPHAVTYTLDEMMVLTGKFLRLWADYYVGR